MDGSNGCKWFSFLALSVIAFGGEPVLSHACGLAALTILANAILSPLIDRLTRRRRALEAERAAWRGVMRDAEIKAIREKRPCHWFPNAG